MVQIIFGILIVLLYTEYLIIYSKPMCQQRLTKRIFNESIAISLIHHDRLSTMNPLYEN